MSSARSDDAALPDPGRMRSSPAPCPAGWGRGIRVSIPVERSPAGLSVGGMAEKRAENQPVDQDDPTGGDEVTEDQLEADNPVEEDTLKTLDPDSPPA